MAYSIPTCVTNRLKALSYRPDTSMAEHVARWWEWYTSTAGWYTQSQVVRGRWYTREISSLHPARRVCREWAATILDDDATTFTVDDGGDGASTAATDALAAWVAETRFLPVAQMCVERAFATGTGALALWFDVVDGRPARVRARRYDARMVLPLSWDDDGVTECALCTQANVGGRKVDQLQMHVLDPATGTYHVRTELWAKDRRVSDPGIIEDFDTGTDRPTFCILKPAIDNTREDGTFMGQSVFADALDAIKGVDNAWDSIQREISASKIKVFATDDMFDVAPGEDGTTARIIPWAPEDVVIRLAGDGTRPTLETFAPDIRLSPLRDALNVAWAEVGDIVGFGKNYLRMDKDGSAKTATEVSSDNAAFARNIRKHENGIGPALERILGALVEVSGWAPAGSRVRVNFDDSVITDTQTEKATALAEVGGGVMAPWEYRARFYGEDEATARSLAAECAQPSVDDLLGAGTML